MSIMGMAEALRFGDTAECTTYYNIHVGRFGCACMLVALTTSCMLGIESAAACSLL
jgi:hypothetical protein